MRSSLLFQFYYNKASCKCVIVAMHINSTKLHLLKDEESDYLFFFSPLILIGSHGRGRPGRVTTDHPHEAGVCVLVSLLLRLHIFTVSCCCGPRGLIHVCVFVLCSKASFNRIHSVLMWLFPAPFLWIEPSIFSDVEVIWNMGNLFIDDLKYSAEGKKKRNKKITWQQERPLFTFPPDSQLSTEQHLVLLFLKDMFTFFPYLTLKKYHIFKMDFSWFYGPLYFGIYRENLVFSETEKPDDLKTLKNRGIIIIVP